VTLGKSEQKKENLEYDPNDYGLIEGGLACLFERGARRVSEFLCLSRG